MESPCPTPPAPGNRRVVRTGCMLADDVIFRCRGRGTGRFHAGVKRQQRVESEGWERWQIWIGTKSLLLKLKTQRFSLDHKSRKLNCPLAIHLPTRSNTARRDTHLRPWCVATRRKWGGSVAGAPSTVRWNERPWGTGVRNSRGNRRVTSQRTRLIKPWPALATSRQLR
jgi:hypothetical protein